MARSTRHAVLCLILGALITVAACGSSSTGPSATADITGVWVVTGSVSNSSLATSCNVQGQATIQESGNTFSGQFTNSTLGCTGPGGSTSGNDDGSITGGQINGSSVNYSQGGCTWSGTVSGTPSNRIQGPVTCQIALSGTTYTFTGTWTASR